MTSVESAELLEWLLGMELRPPPLHITAWVIAAAPMSMFRLTYTIRPTKLLDGHTSCLSGVYSHSFVLLSSCLEPWREHLQAFGVLEGALAGIVSSSHPPASSCSSPNLWNTVLLETILLLKKLKPGYLTTKAMSYNLKMTGVSSDLAMDCTKLVFFTYNRLIFLNCFCSTQAAFHLFVFTLR